MEDTKKRYQAYANAVKAAADKNSADRMAAYSGAVVEKNGRKSIIARLHENRKWAGA